MLKESFQKLAAWAHGRHTLFAIYFTIVGSGLQWCHRLDMNFIYLIMAIQSFVLGHSLKEDWYAQKQPTPVQPQPDGPPVNDKGGQ